MILTGISLNQTALDWDGNLNRILDALLYYDSIKDPRENHIVLFPELSLSGYGCEDGFFFSSSKEKSWENLLKILDTSKKIKNTMIFLGTPFYYLGYIYNTMAVLYHGKILAIIPKSYLAGEGIHYEQRWFTPYKKEWKKIEFTNPQYHSFLFGQGVLDFFGVKIGVEICEDSWVNHRPALSFFYDNDVDIILNPAASHFAFGKYEVRKTIAQSTSFYFHCYYFSINLLGNESGKSIYDGSILLARNGELLYEEERFSFKDILIRSFSIHFEELRNLRAKIYSRKNDRNQQITNEILTIEEHSTIQKPTFDVKENPSNKKQIPTNFIIDYQYIRSLPFLNKNQLNANDFFEFLEVERIALFDYMRKTGSMGYTISLSGGADSSICAILVYQMIRKGILELGIKDFIKKINFQIQEKDLKDLLEKNQEEQIQYICNHLIHTIYQKTNQNSETTYRLANQLASEIHSHHINLEIQSLVDETLSLFESKFNEKLTWENHNIALQNIQSRIRSPIAWLLANITNSILITTSNRSEGAVGYSTMDGDTAGGIAPLAGVNKAFLLKFLNFIHEYEDPYTKPILVAREISEQPPSAELKPLDQKQTDEKELMPYSILAFIETFAIEELLSPKEILDKLIQYKNKTYQQFYKVPYFEDFLKKVEMYSEEELKQMVNKFFKLWHTSQWKRERIATSFHIDSYNIDPRGWFRFPVISKPLQI